MCWSFQVSAAFALAEAVGIGFIYWRATHSADPYVQAQLWILPLLCSIFYAEAGEALVWLDETLLPVNAREGPSCSAYNRNLTLGFWWIVFAAQPLLVVIPARRVGHPRNKDIFVAVEMMAICFILWHTGVYLGKVIPQLRDPTFTPAPPRLNMRQHGYQTFVNSETCSYIGKNGHLFWTLATADCWATPNVVPYLIICASLVFAKPKRFFAGMGLFMGAVMGGLIGYYGGTVEAASVWCWTGIIMNIYVVVQPYILPCNDRNSYSPDTFSYCKETRLTVSNEELEVLPTNTRSCVDKGN